MRSKHLYILAGVLVLISGILMGYGLIRGFQFTVKYNSACAPPSINETEYADGHNFLIVGLLVFVAMVSVMIIADVKKAGENR
jgi:hypothetical protein